MKEHKDLDWEMFELLEGGMNEQDADILLAKILKDEELASDWDLLQNTKLAEPTVVYKRKNELLKKDTAILAFAAIRWKKVVSIAAVFAIALPIGWYMMKNSADVEIAAHVNEVITEPVLPSEDVLEPEASSPLVKAIEESSTEPQIVKYKDQKKSVVESVADPIKAQTVLPEQEQISVVSARPVVDLSVGSSYPNGLNHVMINPQIDYLIPQNVSVGFRGVRPTINSGLALITMPFRGSKIELKPSDNKTLRIEYRSNQYVASAMLSLKPFKN